MSHHDWGWIGWCGILLGVHRCRRCGVAATAGSLHSHCKGKKS